MNLSATNVLFCLVLLMWQSDMPKTLQNKSKAICCCGYCILMSNYSDILSFLVCWPFKPYRHQVVNSSPLSAEMKVVLKYVVRKLSESAGGGEHCFSVLVAICIVLLLKSLKIEGYCQKEDGTGMCKWFCISGKDAKRIKCEI